MKVTVLSENTSECGLATEHGLSLYIETRKHRILFDFGHSAVFAENAVKLGIDLSTVDIAFLSHGHNDHSTGMETFLDLNKHANIYMHEQVFEPHYNGNNEYIGMDETMDGHPRLIKVREDITIDPEISFVTLKKTRKAADTFGQKVKRGKYMEKETYDHEMYLQIREGYKTYIFSGCTHKGIVNLIYGKSFDCFVGGLHTMKYDVLWDEELLLEVSRALKDSGAEYYTCHCTGKEQYLFLKDNVGPRLHSISAGVTIEI